MQKWKVLFSPLYFFGSFVKYNSPLTCGFISRVSHLFHWPVCLFFCQCHAVLIVVSLQYNLKSGSMITPASLPTSYSGLLCLFCVLCGSIHLIIFCCTVLNVMGLVWGFHYICVSLYIIMTILTMLILPIHEHKIFFHFIESFSICFNNACSFQYIGSSHPLLSLYLHIFVALQMVILKYFF